MEEPSWVEQLKYGGILILQDYCVRWDPDKRRIRYGIFRSLPLLAFFLKKNMKHNEICVFFPRGIILATAIHLRRWVFEYRKIRRGIRDVYRLFGNIFPKVNFTTDIILPEEKPLIFFIGREDERRFSCASKIIRMLLSSKKSYQKIIFVVDENFKLKKEQASLSHKLGVSVLLYEQAYYQSKKIIFPWEPLKDTLNAGFQLLALKLVESQSGEKSYYYLKDLFTKPLFKKGVWGAWLEKFKNNQSFWMAILALWIEQETFKKISFNHIIW